MKRANEANYDFLKGAPKVDHLFRVLVLLVETHRWFEENLALPCTPARALVDLFGAWIGDNIAAAYSPFTDGI